MEKNKIGIVNINRINDKEEENIIPYIGINAFRPNYDSFDELKRKLDNIKNIYPPTDDEYEIIKWEEVQRKLEASKYAWELEMEKEYLNPRT